MALFCTAPARAPAAVVEDFCCQLDGQAYGAKAAQHDGSIRSALELRGQTIGRERSAHGRARTQRRLDARGPTTCASSREGGQEASSRSTERATRYVFCSCSRIFCMGYRQFFFQMNVCNAVLGERAVFTLVLSNDSDQPPQSASSAKTPGCKARKAIKKQGVPWRSLHHRAFALETWTLR